MKDATPLDQTDGGKDKRREEIFADQEEITEEMNDEELRRFHEYTALMVYQ